MKSSPNIPIRFARIASALAIFLSIASIANADPPEDRSGQIVILKMDDLRQHNPTTGVHQNWIDLLAKVRAAGAVTTIGIPAVYIAGDTAAGDAQTGAANDLANGGQLWIDWVKAQHAAGDVEFWQHGWDHLPAYDEDASGDTSEFEASPVRQQTHFDDAQNAARDVLGFDFRTFGAPGNKVNADTLPILDAATEINARYYGDDLSLISNAFNIRRFGGSIENPIYFINWATYDDAMTTYADKPYLAFQMHPEYWDANQMANFQTILDDLVARNVTFMTAQQLIEHIAERRAAIGPMVDFNNWGDFDFLFKQGGQVNKYTETAGSGLAGSRALVVGTGGTQSSLVLQKSLPGNTPSLEIALDFQHVTPTSTGGQSLFIGLGPNDRYDPNLGGGSADNDHLLIALDFNGAPGPSQPRLRIASSADGSLTQTTGGYLGTALTAGNWYRLRTTISHDLNGYTIDATLEASDNDGVIGSELLNYSVTGRSVPDLAASDVYPFLGGQGSAYQRGIGALDNFYISVLRPLGRDDGLLAYEGVFNQHYRTNHSSYTGLNPDVLGFATSVWVSGYNANVRPAGWTGATNAIPDSQGLAYTASGGETLLDGFSLRKLETARSVRELNTAAFSNFLTGGEIGLEGTTLYLSCLMQPRLSDVDGQVSFELLSNGNDSSNRVFGIGITRSLDDQFRVALAGNYASPLATLGTATALQDEFFVVKIEFGAGTTPGNERITLWRNPTWLSHESLSTPTAVLADVANFTFDRIGLWNLSGGIAYFDEIRLGSQWQAVAPVKRESSNHVYKSTPQRDLKLWFWQPANWSPSDKRPAMLLIHGGGWAGGDPSKLETQAMHYRDLGYVCIGVEYRLTSEAGVTADISVQDSRSAMRYLKANAAAFGIDPARIVAMGGSAGGHLSLGLSTLNDPSLNDPADDLLIDPSPVATAAFNPVTDTSAPDGFGTSSFATEASALLASPVDQVVPGLPPLIMMHGDADTSVPVEQARALRDAMTAAANAVTYHEYAGAGHGFFNIEDSTNQYNTDTLIQVDDFLTGLGLLPVNQSAPGPVTAIAIDEEAESNLLSWTPPSAATGIRLLRSTNAYVGFNEIATLDGSATGYSDSGLTAGTTYFYRIIAFNALGESATTVDASGLALTYLQDFRMDHFGTIENTGTAADDYDFEPDGLPNLLEFALGGLPKLNDATSLTPSLAIGNDGSNDYLELTFRRLKGTGTGSAEAGYTLDGLTYKVETSTTLQSASWETLPANLEQIGSPTDNSDGTESVTVRIKPEIDPNANPIQFARLAVTGN